MILTLTVVGLIWLVAIPAAVIGVLSFWSRPRHGSRPGAIRDYVRRSSGRPDAGLRLIDGGPQVLRPRVPGADYGALGGRYRP